MDRVINPVKRFFKSSTSGSFLLLFATALALLIANSPWSQVYTNFLHNEFTIGFLDNGFQLTEPFYLWINDGLMAIFFFHVGLEIKREIIGGELTTLQKASLPVMAALGGVIVPIIIYVLLNNNPETAGGWGIPMATDIAFSLGILQLFGKRVPLGLKVFLTAFAIVDDLAAVIVIAIFYGHEVHWDLLMYAGAILAFMTFLGMKQYFSRYIFFPLSIVVWIFFLKSGIHPTIAGVLLAFTIPATRRTTLNKFFDKISDSVQSFARNKEHISEHHILEDEQVHAAHRIKKASELINSPLQKIEHDLHPWVAFFIMPVFAFANAGVNFSAKTDLDYSLVIHIALALIVGKAVGISLASWLSVKSGIAKLPKGVRFPHIIGVSFLGGLGFTMSLFIANLAFTDKAYLSSSKIGILGGSLVACLIGYFMLKAILKKDATDAKH